MSQFVFKMPISVREGEAEIIAWHTTPGATVPRIRSSSK